MTFDGVGEWATSTIGHGAARRLDLLEEVRFPASIGPLYSAFTVAAGFRVNSGEYKLMGLAPFGRPTYVEAIHRHARSHSRCSVQELAEEINRGWPATSQGRATRMGRQRRRHRIGLTRAIDPFEAVRTAAAGTDRAGERRSGHPTRWCAPHRRRRER